MTEDMSEILEEVEILMESSIEHLQKILANIRAGKATPSMLATVTVPYYGAQTPLNQVSNVSTADAKTLVIQPWEKNMLGPIEKAIFEANLGFTPMNDGELIRINIPALTEERRKKLVKDSKSEGEEAKISIRNARRDGINAVKKAVKNGYSEDEGKKKESQIDDLSKKYVVKVDELVQAKEKDIMTI